MKEYPTNAGILVTDELDSNTPEALKVVKDATDAEVKRIKESTSKEAEAQSKGQINNIPPCILNCLHDRFLKSGCAHNNYLCFCSRMTATLLEEKVQSCMKECPYNEEQIYAKVSIVDFCDIHGDEDLQVLFPWFLIEHESNKRQLSSSGISPPSPATIRTTTVLSTAPWGVAPYTTTKPASGGTVMVIEYVTDTNVLTTFFTTTTIPLGQAPYTSTFTDQSSAAVTEVIGVNTGSNSSSGLASGTKIGIGVAIPLAFVALAGVLFWFLRRRKNSQVAQSGAPETYDSGLPEPTSNGATLEEHKSNLPAPTSHELNAIAGEQRHYPSQELSSDQQRYEASGNPIYAGHELPTQPMTPSPAPASPASSPTRKPVALSAPSPGPSSSAFTPPWDSSGAAEYEKDLNIGPAEAAVAEDQELKELEEEVARVKMQKQRLQELQALEAREDELKRSIAERKKMGAKKP
ncbi:hypothetical protein N431DRAFT_412782 [Stipitochalara longipes BDJ]|nr:hypothetical protein N431DRAFT_412782 [Stipitochalara longipes BDJ]